MKYNCEDLSKMFDNIQTFRYSTDDLSREERKIFIVKLHSCGIFIKDIPKLFPKKGRPKKN